MCCCWRHSAHSSADPLPPIPPSSFPLPGVEIAGNEYTYAGGAGIFAMSPKVAPGAVFRESIPLGTLVDAPRALRRALDILKPDFGPDDYSLVKKNCNQFVRFSFFLSFFMGWGGIGGNCGHAAICIIFMYLHTLPPSVLHSLPIHPPTGQRPRHGAPRQAHPRLPKPAGLLRFLLLLLPPRRHDQPSPRESR